MTAFWRQKRSLRARRSSRRIRAIDVLERLHSERICRHAHLLRRRLVFGSMPVLLMERCRSMPASTSTTAAGTIILPLLILMLPTLENEEIELPFPSVLPRPFFPSHPGERKAYRPRELHCKVPQI
jgi:hypothetical protein